MSRIRRPCSEAAALMASHGIRVRHQAKLPTAPVGGRARGEAADHRRRAADACVGDRAVDGAVSIAAGRTLANLASHLPQGTAVVRAMPNTPAAIGQGMTVACASAEVTRDQALRCNMLLEAVGDVIWMDDESLIDAATAVSGSGPAYVFLLAECPAEAGVEAGLDLSLPRGWRGRPCPARASCCAARTFPRPSSGKMSPRRKA